MAIRGCCILAAMRGTKSSTNIMPIPTNIDPVRVLTRCFGIELPPDTPKGRKESLDALFEFLELSPTTRKDLARIFKPALRTMTDLTSTRGEGWLEFPDRIVAMTTASETMMLAFMQALSPEVQAKIGKRLDNPRIPSNVLNQLFPVLIDRMVERTGDQAAEPRRFCHTLLTRFPATFSRARRLYEVHLQEFGTTSKPAKDPVQAFSRVMDRLERAQKSSRRPRATAEAALHAWAGAFEDSIFNVSLFLWYVAKPIDTPPEKLIPAQGAAGRARLGVRQEARKGQIFKEVRAWCAENGVDFPFYPHLDKIRHAHAHEDYVVVKDRVDLHGHDGMFDSMTVKDLLSKVNHDVHFAFYFQQGANEAAADRLASSPELDAAWQTAIQWLPSLANAVKPGSSRRHRQADIKSSPKTARKTASQR